VKIRENLKISLLVLTILWGVFFINILIHVDLRMYGIRPRQIDGLWGIILSHFLHGDFRHLMTNSVALLVLLTVSLSYSQKLTIKALLIVIILGGGLVWLLGRGRTVHIGASGIIFGLIGFLLFIGIFRREWKAFAFSLGIFLFYGGALISLFIYIPGISWTGHFFSFLGGAIAAWWTRTEWTR
jgi:membrane associated rhomboid family serine protease